MLRTISVVLVMVVGCSSHEVSEKPAAPVARPSPPGFASSSALHPAAPQAQPFSERELEHGPGRTAEDEARGLARQRAVMQHERLHDEAHESHVNSLWDDSVSELHPSARPSCTWRSIGPTNIPGRVTGIAVAPGEKVYITTVGGVWRSLDAARTWERVSDDPYLPAYVYAAVAVNPGDADEVFVAPGDPQYTWPSWFGVLRSTRGGAPGTWARIGGDVLDKLTIYKIRVDPGPSHSLWVATSGGVFHGTRTANNDDVTWARVGTIDGKVTDLVLDASGSAPVLYAGLAGPSSAGQRAGIWRFDAGAAGADWQDRGNGIDAGRRRTVALAIANARVLYAKVERDDGFLLGVYRSDDSAQSWSKLPGWEVLNDSRYDSNSGYSWYNNVIEVDPSDENVVYAGGMSPYRWSGATQTWTEILVGSDHASYFPAHPDQHAFAFSPADPHVVYAGNDGGLIRATIAPPRPWAWSNVAHGVTTTELYHVVTQRGAARLLAGGSQDNGLLMTFGNRTWYQPAVCDGFQVGIDPLDRDTLYGSCNGSLERIPRPVPGAPDFGRQLFWSSPLRLAFLGPFAVDPARAGSLVALAKRPDGTTRFVRTTDPESWEELGAPLGPKDEVKFVAIAPSSQFRTYYAGVIRREAPDGGPPTATDEIRHFDQSGWHATVVAAEPRAVAVDPGSSRRAFAVISNGATGALLATTDEGATWKPVIDPKSSLTDADLSSLTIDPGATDTLYVGTSVGPYEVRVDAKLQATWKSLDQGLPTGVEVRDLSLNPDTRELTIATRGYGTYGCNLADADARNVRLLVRDNVFDTGVRSPSGVPDPEHPDCTQLCSPSKKHPVTWIESNDIRVYVPAPSEPPEATAHADAVEIESCPIDVRRCPPGALVDSNPQPGQPANVFVQVQNLGTAPAHKARVLLLWAPAAPAFPKLPANLWTSVFPKSGDCGAPEKGSGWHLVDAKQPCHETASVNPERPEIVSFTWQVPRDLPAYHALLAIVDSPDDPIPPAVRARHSPTLEALVRSEPHLALRSMHIVDLGNKAALPAELVEELKTDSATTGRRVRVLSRVNGEIVGGTAYIVRP